jgi:hypothetical protein
MTRHIKGKNGKFAGSIGDGKTKTPKATQAIPAAPAAHTPETYGEDIDALYARFGAQSTPIPSLTTGTPPASPVIFDTPTTMPVTTLRGIYTEYLAEVGQLEREDLEEHSRSGPYDWAALTTHIRENGIQEPIEVGVDDDGDMYVINGSHRAVIACELRLSEVPVIYRQG